MWRAVAPVLNTMQCICVIMHYSAAIHPGRDFVKKIDHFQAQLGIFTHSAIHILCYSVKSGFVKKIQQA